MKKKDIGKLYGEQFQNFEAPVSSKEWLAVKAGVSTNKLLALHIVHFKVYYIVAALAVGSSGVATGVYQYYNSNSDKTKEPIQNEIMIQPSAKEEKTDSIIHFEEGVSNLKKKEQAEKEPSSEQKNNIQISHSRDTVKNVIETIPVKTEENKNSKVDTTSTIRPKAPAKRIVYVNKRDTIVVRDTVTELPKKKKKK